MAEKINTKHILITKDNSEDFQSVIPQGALLPGDAISIGAVNEDGEVLGALTFRLSDYEYFIDWLYVVPSYRRCRVASSLLDEFVSFMNHTGELYQVSVRFEATDEDLSLYGLFLSRDDFEVAYSHMRYNISAKELVVNERLRTKAQIELEEKEFFSLPKDEQTIFLDTVCANSEFVVSDRDIWEKRSNQKLSRIVLKGKELLAAIFIMDKEDGDLEIGYLYSASAWATRLLLNSVYLDIIKYYKSSGLSFDAVGKNAIVMAKKMFPKAATVCIYEATR